MYTGAGILIFETYHGHTYIILVRDKTSYSEPGGSANPEETPKVTASRECLEETCGLIKIDPIYLQMHVRVRTYIAFVICLTGLRLEHYDNDHKIAQKYYDQYWNETSGIARIRLDQLHMFHIRDRTRDVLKCVHDLPHSQQLDMSHGEHGLIQHIIGSL
jgi:8-oxo-dGTP pyrophosphatase MutT (NUDIX family)